MLVGCRRYDGGQGGGWERDQFGVGVVGLQRNKGREYQKR